MNRSHDQVIEGQFGPQAKAYVESAVHATGPDLEALDALLQATKPKRLLDLGAGGGHVSYLASRHAAEVVASDLSNDMLAAVAAAAQERNLTNIETIQAAAESLPFSEGEFDALVCRYSAHHWRDFEAGLRQARRVVRDGANAIFIDAISPGAPLFDTHLQAVELLRDPSHVRDFSLAEWMAALTRARLTPGNVRRWRIRMDFPAWTARMRTPHENVSVIRAMQSSAAEETERYFAIEPDGSFLLDVALFETRAD
jgi:SAM-dependent methyltransferase